MSTSWRIVKFINTDEDNETIETVPTTWVNDDGQHCYWPPFGNKKDLEKAIKSAWSPNKEWTLHKVKMIGSKEYNNFKIATAKATKALKFSEIDSNSEFELPTKRVRKINKRKFESSSEGESDEGEDELAIPSYPPLPSNLRMYLLCFYSCTLIMYI